MRRVLALFAPFALWTACSSDPGSRPATTPVRGFDLVWSAFDETYPYFGLKQVDWGAARATYRSRAAGAADVAALNAILLDMLGTLRDVHVALESPSGQRTLTWRPTATVNFDQSLWQRVVTASGWIPLKPNLGRARIDGVPYISIGAWNSTQFSVADLDAALEPFRGDSVLMVDVRSNGGGDDALALDFARRFTDRTLLTEIFRFRTGPGPNDLGRETRRTISPRGPWQFGGRVYVLSGRGVFSSNESFISAMREVPRGVIVGDTTGGGTGNPVAVPYYQGWKVWVSRWFATTPDGAPIEGRGIPPDVAVPWSAAGPRDPVIYAAIALAMAGAEDSGLGKRHEGPKHPLLKEAQTRHGGAGVTLVRPSNIKPNQFGPIQIPDSDHHLPTFQLPD